MTQQKRISIRCSVGLLVMAFAYNAAQAQVLYGTLTGNVTDPASAVVPKVHVLATAMDTNIKHETDTDARGVYRFSDLQPGLYQVNVDAVSFKKFIETNVQVQAGAVIRVDVQLQIASATESIEVAADSVVLQTDRSDVHTEISQTEVEQLPYNGTEGKNFQALVLLQPGTATTAGTGEANSAAGNPQRAITVFQNGVSSQANNTRLDGALNAYPWLPVNIAYVPSPEAIQAVSISSNAFDAETRVAGGYAMNVVMKTGTNQLHGSMFERNTNQDHFAMSIDASTVRRIAHLARLSVDDAHMASVAAELAGVLHMAGALQKADLDGVEPLAHPHEQTLALRDDAITEYDRADAFLALAPESRGGLFLVPKVIE